MSHSRFRRRARRHTQAGFTLIELLVVMVILGLLASIIGGDFFSKIASSKVRTAETQMKMIQQELTIFKIDVGRMPTTEEGVAALVSRPAGLVAWNGPYMQSVPADPWGQPYRYRSPGENGVEYELATLGRDGKAGGSGEDGDIVMTGAKQSQQTSN